MTKGGSLAASSLENTAGSIPVHRLKMDRLQGDTKGRYK
jgi:hypothetical protein